MHDSPYEHSHGSAEFPVRVVRKAASGPNVWNRGKEPADWWQELINRHGHVGPWNVLGYRMGRYILRELGTPWGSHEYVITAHIPPTTPYSCILDGLAVGTGNSEGRLDLLWAEVALPELTHVSVRRASDRKLLLVFLPRPEYLERISQGTVRDLEQQSRECEKLAESELFEVRWLEPALQGPSYLRL
ncbi:MAG: formylmethanofuran dehydrogenase subunit E family protein, partial [Candidatus Sumerlaeaceae bacterium]|jgi:formylmethanofuran dehydrogenase subunit E